jgi:pyruvate kinase
MEIFCTVGPASLRPKQIRELSELGATLFRINLSHTDLDAVADLVRHLRRHTSVPICLDTEGAQIRTGQLANGRMMVRRGRLLYVHEPAIVGEGAHLSFYPPGVIQQFRLGDLVSVDSTLVQVIASQPTQVTARVLSGGKIGSNKAVTVLDHGIELPALTQKDHAALRLGVQLGIQHVALSFANRASDVDELRRVTDGCATVIAKIECRAGVQNLSEIGGRADALLIDRGDLSREVPVEQIPGLQKAIIRTGETIGKKVYVATNLLESMVSSPTPTRAEVNDVYNTLLDGANGLVLAAETAIGRYPTDCLRMVQRVICQFEQEQRYVAAPVVAAVQLLRSGSERGRMSRSPLDFGGDLMTDPTFIQRQRPAGRASQAPQRSPAPVPGRAGAAPGSP